MKAIELKYLGYDYVIDLHNNLRTQVIKSVLGVESQSFDKVNFEKWLAVNFKQISILPNIHIVDRYLNTCKTIDVSNDNEGLDFFINPNENIGEAKILIQGNYIAWAIGAQHYTKRFPFDKIIEVSKKLSMKIVLLGSKEDIMQAEINENALPNNMISFCGKLNIHQSAIMVRDAKLLVTNDTGLMHIGAAFKKPIVSLWGNTIQEFGMTPYFGKYNIKHSAFNILNLSCRPCSKIGFKQCPKKHFNCMNLLNVDDLARTIQHMFLN